MNKLRELFGHTSRMDYYIILRGGQHVTAAVAHGEGPALQRGDVIERGPLTEDEYQDYLVALHASIRRARLR